MTALDLSLYGLAACALGIVACVGWWREVRGLEAETKRRTDAELACECLRASLMRGSAVATWTWPAGTRPTSADPHYLHVKTALGDLLITPESFAAERARADKYLR